MHERFTNNKLGSSGEFEKLGHYHSGMFVSARKKAQPERHTCEMKILDE